MMMFKTTQVGVPVIMTFTSQFASSDLQQRRNHPSYKELKHEWKIRQSQGKTKTGSW
jgi:hypothetical protein